MLCPCHECCKFIRKYNWNLEELCKRLNLPVFDLYSAYFDYHEQDNKEDDGDWTYPDEWQSNYNEDRTDFEDDGDWTYPDDDEYNTSGSQGSDSESNDYNSFSPYPGQYYGLSSNIHYFPWHPSIQKIFRNQQIFSWP